MGIPSFYKHLLQTIVGITTKTRPKTPQFFGLDLNCAIYHCVKKIQTKNPYVDENRIKWDSELINEVVAYIKMIRTIVNPSNMLYIAVDGVAPFAKMKQQRVRRFKSAVQAEEERRVRSQAQGVPYIQQPRWDTNAITPGTMFMDALTKALKTYSKTDPTKITVSSADEPGEGEQKIMNYLRSKDWVDAVIYGLDADLIVLSLYANAKQGIQIDLFREEVEISGGVKSDSSGKESFLYLQTSILSDALYEQYADKDNQSKSLFLIDFVALMSLLGNDFVPHGMALKIREEGIEKLLAIYKDELTCSLLHNDMYNREALKIIFQHIKEKEPQWMLKGIKGKLNARPFCHSRDLADIAVSQMNDLPVKWAAELCMVDVMPSTDNERKQQYQLKSNWSEIYDKEALWGANPSKVANTYLEALEWTFAYYRGETIDTWWFYPWPLPPRAESVLQQLDKPIKIPNTLREPIKPLEQLAMVLPMSSFTLLPQEYKDLGVMYPHAWPVSWPMYSFGRRFLWECEPLIPLIQPKQIKQWIETLYET